MSDESVVGQGPLGSIYGPSPGGDVLGEVRGVVGDESEESGPSGVLPRQTEDVQPGDVGHPPPLHGMTVRDDPRDVDPRVIGPVAGGPDHDEGVQAAAVGEPRALPLGAHEAGTEPDAGTLEPSP